MQKLISGKFECPECGTGYLAENDPESELVCEDCDQELTAADDEDDDSDED